MHFSSNILLTCLYSWCKSWQHYTTCHLFFISGRKSWIDKCIPGRGSTSYKAFLRSSSRGEAKVLPSHPWCWWLQEWRNCFWASDTRLDWSALPHPLPYRWAQLKFWPNEPPEFRWWDSCREVIHEYTAELRVMYKLLVKLIADCLNVEEDCFLKDNGRGENGWEIQLLPMLSFPWNVLGVKPHADIQCFCRTRGVHGLQVLKDDHWFRFQVTPDAMFVNVGDVLEIISNSILIIPVHWVVTNSDMERISLAVFCFLDPKREIGPVAGLSTSDRPQMYKTVKDYDSIFFEHYQLGQRPLNDVKL